MRYQLINPVNPNYSALEQVLTNRGIKYEDIPHYVNTTDDDINSFLLLAEEEILQKAVIWILEAIRENKDIIIIVDSDCDGFTSSSLLINYLYDLFPAWVMAHVHWIIHSGKQHGLSDCCDDIIKRGYSLVIVPDAGSNDYEYQEKLFEAGIKTIVLDHHEIEEPEKIKNAIVINNQWGNYPNRQLSGVGVVWQFCRYIDALMNSDNANNYLDLVALGNTADMMSLTSLETKHLINKGFEPDNIHNPFIYSIWQKNQFKLGEHITSWGAAFYIAPFVNAMVRSGTQEEKELLFESMLKMRAFDMVPSTKRGCKGQEEQIVEQAIRTCTNVKNRQTRAQDAGLEFLENMIQEQNLLDNKVILFLLKPGQVDRNIAGLIANKFMAKYQRPCCILTRVEEDVEHETTGIVNTVDGKVELGTIYLKDKRVSYQGSARGCDKVGVTEFKDICAETGVVMYTIGHQGAFGLGIEENNVKDFIDITNDALKDMSEEPLYYVDYIYDGGNVNPQNILDIAEMDSYWGKDIETPILAIEKLKVTKNMVTIYEKSNLTIKITLENGVNLMLFNATEEDCNKLQINNNGYVEINCVGTANKNVWMDRVTPQIFIEEYEIIDSNKYYF